MGLHKEVNPTKKSNPGSSGTIKKAPLSRIGPVPGPKLGGK